MPDKTKDGFERQLDEHIEKARNNIELRIGFANAAADSDEWHIEEIAEHSNAGLGFFADLDFANSPRQAEAEEASCADEEEEYT